MEIFEIQVTARNSGVKNVSRRLRREGRIPGVLYGPKTEPTPLAMDKREFSLRIAGLEGSHLVRLKSDAQGLAEKVALVKEMQYDALSGEVMHADFYEVDLSAKIQVNVPLHFVGRAAGVVRGGILQPIAREVEVECLPMDIPEFFNIDVSALDIGDSIHVEDIAMPDGVSSIAETNYPVVTVAAPTVEEEKPVAAAEGAPAAAPEEKKESA